jgi:hypothetical protein
MHGPGRSADPPGKTVPGLTQNPALTATPGRWQPGATHVSLIAAT